MIQALRIALAFAAITAVAPSAGKVATMRATGQREAAPAAPGIRAGQSVTQLPDGTWLLIGGRRDGRAEAVLEVWNPDTRRVNRLPTRLSRPRAEHSATLLGDGRLLIVGGIDEQGQVDGSGEIFDPSTGRLETLTSRLAPRASHSATLLTDGRVLVAGGIDQAGQIRADAFLWDPSSGQIGEPIDMTRAAR